ncbi:hypothetical protein P5P86_06185 [Nocardioides sp. BP30]|uniref:DUF6542 domain-containing protein n=1 Tax=Nocardioides sp. BP30 TaxID=3036374 RepID=UPI002469C5FD|nr:DUF6542 domain-containing protein [Nocardioides sp. BP30]WGL53415.1 hypothetical protein P5P86_06185 [Nocardioides sp. BP30]
MSRTIWDEGHEPGGRVVALAVALALTVAVIDSLLAGRVEVLFDVCFVLICTGVALLVHPRDFFFVGVLPPLLMLGIFGLFALSSRSGIGAAHGDGFLQALISALGHHSIALFIGYALALACLVIRRNRLLRGTITRGSATSRPHPPARPQAYHPTSR